MRRLARAPSPVPCRIADHSLELHSNSVGPGALAGAALDTTQTFAAAGALARGKRKLRCCHPERGRTPESKSLP
jgi:hypothetical protein